MMKLNKDILYQRLNDALSPIMLDVIDESHLHIGHLGSNAGGHYESDANG